MNLFQLSKLVAGSRFTYRLLRIMRGKGHFDHAAPEDVVALAMLGLDPATAAQAVAETEGFHAWRRVSQVGDSIEWEVTIERR